MIKALLPVCLIALAFGAFGTFSSYQAHQRLSELRIENEELLQGMAKAGDKIADQGSVLEATAMREDVEALASLAETLSERVLELESDAANPFDGRVRSALADDPQMIFDAIDLMNERAAQTALADARPILENDAFLPVYGNPDGDVTLVEFYDYNCGYCRRALADVMELVAEDGNIRLIFKEFPVLSRESQEAAITALAAAPDVDFLELHRSAMSYGGQVNAEVMLDLAVALGADRATVATRAALERSAYVTEISQVQGIAGALGITGTPAFIIGDQVIPGAVGKAELARVVAEIRSAQEDG